MQRQLMILNIGSITRIFIRIMDCLTKCCTESRSNSSLTENLHALQLLQLDRKRREELQNARMVCFFLHLNSRRLMLGQSSLQEAMKASAEQIAAQSKVPMDNLNWTIDRFENRLASFESKLDRVLAIIETNPKALKGISIKIH